MMEITTYNQSELLKFEPSPINLSLPVFNAKVEDIHYSADTLFGI
jgi:hypothetical protein